MTKLTSSQNIKTGQQKYSLKSLVDHDTPQYFQKQLSIQKVVSEQMAGSSYGLSRDLGGTIGGSSASPTSVLTRIENNKTPAFGGGVLSTGDDDEGVDVGAGGAQTNVGIGTKLNDKFVEEASGSGESDEVGDGVSHNVQDNGEEKAAETLAGKVPTGSIGDNAQNAGELTSSSSEGKDEGGFALGKKGKQEISSSSGESSSDEKKTGALILKQEENPASKDPAKNLTPRGGPGAAKNPTPVIKITSELNQQNLFVSRNITDAGLKSPVQSEDMFKIKEEISNDTITQGGISPSASPVGTPMGSAMLSSKGGVQAGMGLATMGSKTLPNSSKTLEKPPGTGFAASASSGQSDATTTKKPGSRGNSTTQFSENDQVFAIGQKISAQSNESWVGELPNMSSRQGSINPKHGNVHSNPHSAHSSKNFHSKNARSIISIGSTGSSDSINDITGTMFDQTGSALQSKDIIDARLKAERVQTYREMDELQRQEELARGHIMYRPQSAESNNRPAHMAANYTRKYPVTMDEFREREKKLEQEGGHMDVRRVHSSTSSIGSGAGANFVPGFRSPDKEVLPNIVLAKNLNDYIGAVGVAPTNIMVDPMTGMGTMYSRDGMESFYNPKSGLVRSKDRTPDVKDTITDSDAVRRMKHEAMEANKSKSKELLTDANKSKKLVTNNPNLKLNKSQLAMKNTGFDKIQQVFGASLKELGENIRTAAGVNSGVALGAVGLMDVVNGEDALRKTVLARANNNEFGGVGLSSMPHIAGPNIASQVSGVSGLQQQDNTSTISGLAASGMTGVSANSNTLAGISSQKQLEHPINVTAAAPIGIAGTTASASGTTAAATAGTAAVGRKKLAVDEFRREFTRGNGLPHTETTFGNAIKLFAPSLFYSNDNVINPETGLPANKPNALVNPDGSPIQNPAHAPSGLVMGVASASSLVTMTNPFNCSQTKPEILKKELDRTEQVRPDHPLFCSPPSPHSPYRQVNKTLHATSRSNSPVERELKTLTHKNLRAIEYNKTQVPRNSDGSDSQKKADPDSSETSGKNANPNVANSKPPLTAFEKQQALYQALKNPYHYLPKAHLFIEGADILPSDIGGGHYFKAAHKKEPKMTPEEMQNEEFQKVLKIEGNQHGIVPVVTPETSYMSSGHGVSRTLEGGDVAGKAGTAAKLEGTEKSANTKEGEKTTKVLDSGGAAKSASKKHEKQSQSYGSSLNDTSVLAMSQDHQSSLFSIQERSSIMQDHSDSIMSVGVSELQPLHQHDSLQQGSSILSATNNVDAGKSSAVFKTNQGAAFSLNTLPSVMSSSSQHGHGISSLQRKNSKEDLDKSKDATGIQPTSISNLDLEGASIMSILGGWDSKEMELIELSRLQQTTEGKTAGNKGKQVMIHENDTQTLLETYNEDFMDQYRSKHGGTPEKDLENKQQQGSTSSAINGMIQEGTSPIADCHNYHKGHLVNNSSVKKTDQHQQHQQQHGTVPHHLQKHCHAERHELMFDKNTGKMGLVESKKKRVPPQYAYSAGPGGSYTNTVNSAYCTNVNNSISASHHLELRRAQHPKYKGRFARSHKRVYLQKEENIRMGITSSTGTAGSVASSYKQNITSVTSQEGCHVHSTQQASADGTTTGVQKDGKIKSGTSTTSPQDDTKSLKAGGSQQQQQQAHQAGSSSIVPQPGVESPIAAAAARQSQHQPINHNPMAKLVRQNTILSATPGQPTAQGLQSPTQKAFGVGNNNTSQQISIASSGAGIQSPLSPIQPTKYIYNTSQPPMLGVVGKRSILFERPRRSDIRKFAIWDMAVRMWGYGGKDYYDEEDWEELEGQNMLDERLIELMYRDITPEDYDTLLGLDESVAKKTASKSVMEKLEVVAPEQFGGLSDEQLTCGVCYTRVDEDQEERERIFRMPCGLHIFHEACVTKWLLECKAACPTCHFPVGEELECKPVEGGAVGAVGGVEGGDGTTGIAGSSTDGSTATGTTAPQAQGQKVRGEHKRGSHARHSVAGSSARHGSIAGIGGASGRHGSIAIGSDGGAAPTVGANNMIGGEGGIVEEGDEEEDSESDSGFGEGDNSMSMSAFSDENLSSAANPDLNRRRNANRRRSDDIGVARPTLYGGGVGGGGGIPGGGGSGGGTRASQDRGTGAAGGIVEENKNVGNALDGIAEDGEENVGNNTGGVQRSPYDSIVGGGGNLGGGGDSGESPDGNVDFRHQSDLGKVLASQLSKDSVLSKMSKMSLGDDDIEKEVLE